MCGKYITGFGTDKLGDGSPPHVREIPKNSADSPVLK